MVIEQLPDATALEGLWHLANTSPAIWVAILAGGQIAVCRVQTTQHLLSSLPDGMAECHVEAVGYWSEPVTGRLTVTWDHGPMESWQLRPLPGGMLELRGQEGPLLLRRSG